jgi:DNA-binding PadR family transcriptional regulator
MPAHLAEPPDAFLPLPVAEFHILVTLARGALHGYAIMTEVEQRTEGAVRLGPGTLYTALRRMLDRGLVANGGRDGEDRRLSYEISALGRDVVVAEVARMNACVAMARATPLAPRLATR